MDLVLIVLRVLIVLENQDQSVPALSVTLETLSSHAQGENARAQETVVLMKLAMVTTARYFMEDDIE